MNMIETPRGPIVVHSSGAGPPLLWVHGYTLDSTIWGPLWQAIPGRRHVGLDLPGHGASRPFTTDDRIGDLVDAVAIVADQVGARDAIGLSLGATLCLHLLARRPDRFARMVLCAPSLPGGPVDQESADCNQQLRRLAREKGVGPWLAERWLSDPPAIFAGARRHPALFDDLRAVVARHRWSELGYATMMGEGRDILGVLTQVSTDIRLVIGDDDMPSFARTAELLRRIFPSVAIGRIADAGHLGPLERPDVAATMIAEHITRPG